MTPYWRLWISDGLSNLADGVLKVAVPLIAAGLTRSPTLIAGLGVAFTLPWLVCALPAGALVDRLDRKRAMLVANAIRGALLIVLLGAPSIWALYAVALCVGVTETIYDTSAQSIVPQLVGRDQLPRANGRLYAVELMANEFAGPPLAGLLVGLATMAAFGAPIALWAASVAVLATLPGRYRVERSEPSTIRADIAEGLRFLWRHPVLRTFTVSVGLFNLATSAAFTMLVLYAVAPKGPMGLSEQAYGVLLTGTAVGSLVGSVLAERIERALGRSRALWISYLVGAVTIATPTVTTDPVAVGIALFTSGVGVMVTNIVMVSLRQRLTPDHLLGRLNSAHRLVGWGTKPLGAALGGVLADLLGLRPVFAVVALLPLLALPGLIRLAGDTPDSVDRI
ncbi:MFS transporter [Kutzneria buriramensis]|uniref:MFS transporter n=1 Tax=Kutzneria buriramensis TaxID=1045776 RepID=UPI001FE90CFD|nr:MFS transporter [Kutzneria buriramensis]